MTSFLEYVAEDIIRKTGMSQSRIAIVFPNKRASLFMNEYLARQADGPIWSPAYITISDLFRQHSDLNVADPILSICLLHQSYCAITGSDETLDKFYGWGQLLLSDFDDIDKNMADADRVLANLSDIHELDDLSYLTDASSVTSPTVIQLNSKSDFSIYGAVWPTSITTSNNVFSHRVWHMKACSIDR